MGVSAAQQLRVLEDEEERIKPLPADSMPNRTSHRSPEMTRSRCTTGSFRGPDTELRDCRRKPTEARRHFD